MAKMCGNALRALAAAFIVGLLALSGASAQSGNPIKIGMSLALTGAGASPSKVINTALEIWRDDVNAKGGLLGRPVELVIYDDQSTPANVPGIYTKLITVDKVDLLLGPYGTNFVAPAMPTIIQNKKMTISFTAIGINDKFHYDEILLDGLGRARGREFLLDRLLRHGGGAEAEAADRRDPRRRRRIRAKRRRRARARRSRSTASSSSTTRAIRRARRTSRRWCARCRRPIPTSSISAPIRRTTSASSAPPTRSGCRRR